MPVASLPRGGGGGRSELGLVEQAMVGPSRQKKTKKTIGLDKQGRLQDFGRGGGVGCG